MKKSLWEILIPVRSNEGKPFSDKYYNNVFYALLIDVAKGYTKLAPVDGAWETDGQLYKEKMIPVRVLCTKKEIEGIAAFVVIHYNQLAVMYYKVSNECYIKEDK
jgi:hypothetical protein